MPRAPKRCGRGGCDELMPCTTHRVKRPSPSSRGYDAEHRAARSEWAPKVEAGQVHCRRGEKCRRYPNTLIEPGKPWHLGHPDQECPAPRAPEHMGCNVSTNLSSRR